MKIRLLFALLLSALCSTLHAETKKEPTPAQAAQHAKMKACNAEAKEKKLTGDERKSFMSTCLKAKASS